jgi:hypothetical protein
MYILPYKIKFLHYLSFHDLDLLRPQPVQLIHQLIDLPVRGVDLALEGGLFVVGLGEKAGLQLPHADPIFFHHGEMTCPVSAGLNRGNHRVGNDR